MSIGDKTSLELIHQARKLFLAGKSAKYVSDAMHIGYERAKRLRHICGITGQGHEIEVPEGAEDIESESMKYNWLKKNWHWKIPEKKPKRKWKLKTPYHW